MWAPCSLCMHSYGGRCENAETKEKAVIGWANQPVEQGGARLDSRPVVCVVAAVFSLGRLLPGDLLHVLQAVYRRCKQPAYQKGGQQHPGTM